MRLKDNYDLEANIELKSNYEFKKKMYEAETISNKSKSISPLEKYRKK